MFDNVWFGIYWKVGLVVSILYGVYAVTIWFRAPKPDESAPRVDWEAWGQAWKDLVSHPTYLHQAWFNFFGAAVGWVGGGYLWWRIADDPRRFGWVEAGLALTAALGIVGFLPNAIHSIAGAIRYVGEWAVRVLERLLGISKPTS